MHRSLLAHYVYITHTIEKEDNNIDDDEHNHNIETTYTNMSKT